MEKEKIEFVFGDAELKESENGIKRYEYKPKIKAVDVFNATIEDALTRIDKSHQMDMDSLLSMYQFAHSSMRLYRKLVEELVENPSQENIMMAKTILQETPIN